jgi:hypothetical protein
MAVIGVRYLCSFTIILFFFLPSMAQSQSSQEAGTPNPSQAQPADQSFPVPRLLSVKSARFLKENPAAWSEFVSRLYQATPTGHKPPKVKPAYGGTWQLAANPLPEGGACNPLLLLDGTVLVHECNASHWFRLTPDITGSYVNGTWTTLASPPKFNGKEYSPYGFASAVLPSGQVIVMGGEYDGSGKAVWTNEGAIYDPVANAWTAVAPPPFTGWTNIGDAASTVLADGTFFLSSCCGFNPATDALFDSSTLTWTSTGAPVAEGYQDEQGYELLPNGNVLTVDIYTNTGTGVNGGNATNAEQYDPSLGMWISAGNTPVSLPDPQACGTDEIGPAVLRPDGTVVAFGANTGCISGQTADPTAIYDSSTNTWSAGPYLPAVCGPDANISCTLPDAPAAMLPNGNILFAANFGSDGQQTNFFEFTSSNVVNEVASPLLHSNAAPAFIYNFLNLPNGQILSTDFSSAVEFYTPVGSPDPTWAPAISSAPSSVAPGTSYSISGTQFNGLTQGSYYGDDVQAATNYPIVQITNSATGHVFYAPTEGASNSSVAPGDEVSTNFSLPNGIEAGPGQLVVIANGIASEPQAVVVSSTLLAVTVSPDSLTFAKQAVDSTSDAKTVTVKNIGPGTVTLTAAASGAFAISSDTCGATIAVGESCKVGVTFTPPSAATFSGSLTFTDTASNSPQVVALSGTGEAQAALSPASAKYPKTPVGTTSTPKTFTLTNNLPSDLTGIAASTSGAFAISATTCNATLTSKAKCTISVVFEPVNSGTTTGSLSVSDSAVNSPQTATLTGMGN